LRARGLFVLCVAVSFAPSFARADWRAFVPRPFENGAYLDVFTSYERDRLRIGSRSSHWSDLFLREKLTLFSNGYSYDPRFLVYQISLAAAQRQENYESSAIESLGWRSRSSFEYDVKVILLPEHHYNLTLYDRRYEAMYKEQAATQHNAVQTSRGASLRYRKKPYFFSLHYGRDEVESAESSSDVDRLSVEGEYFKRFRSGKELSFNAAFNPSWFSSSGGIKGSDVQYVIGNFLNLERVRLNSSLSQDSFEQESLDSEKFETENFLWYELMSVYLPWNFRSDVSYRYQDNQSRFPEAGPGTEHRLSNKGDDIQVDVTHRLYESLDTTYSFLRGSRKSFGGDSTAESQSLTLNYTKTIPRGRLLAGTSLARSNMINSGQVDVVNEAFSSTLPMLEPYRLRQPNVARESINVLFTSCVSPFDTRVLDPAFYSVVPAQNTFEIRVQTLPEQYLCTPSTTYAFSVSYSFSGDFELRSDTVGANVSVELFENFLTPYFSYLKSSSSVLSGQFPGVPLDTTAYATGLVMSFRQLRLRGEYSELQWEVSPYRAWKADAQYVVSLTSTTSAYATASYVNKYYPRGTSTSFTGPYTEEAESVSGSIQKQLPLRSLFLSAGGSYSRIQGLADTDAYSANASLSWKIGKLELSAAASAYASDSSGGTGFATRREHELFTINVRRRLY